MKKTLISLVIFIFTVGVVGLSGENGVVSLALPVPPAIAQSRSTTSDAGPLKIVGQIGGPTHAVAVGGHYAYVGVGLRLIVVDVTAPGSLKEVGFSEPLAANVQNVTVSQDKAFVAAGVAGLYIIDISDPTHPTIIGNYDTPGYAEGVTVTGKYAYVADGPAGLRIINITDPAKPQEVSAVYSLNYTSGVAIEDGYAYVAAAGAGLLVADIADPTHPTEVGSYYVPGYAYGVTTLGSTVYIADGWAGLQVLDVSNPRQPKSIASYDTTGWAMDVAVVGDMLYSANATGGLRVLSVSDKVSPKELGSFQVPNGISTHLAVSGGTAYLADIQMGIHIVNVSVPTQPHREGLYNPMGYALAVEAADGYAYVAAQNYGIRVIDVADPTHPREVATLASDLPAKTMSISGATAYVGTEFDSKSKRPPNLYAVDISDPLHPKASSPQPLIGHTGIATFKGGSRPSGDIIYVNTRNMFIQKTILYDAGEWGLLLLDISNPLSPREISFIQTVEDPWGSGATATGVAIAGNTAYLAVSDAGLYTIDVSNPKQPALLGVFNKPPSGKNSKGDQASDVVVAPPFAYVLYRDFVQVVDISDPRRPRGLGSYPVPIDPFVGRNGGAARSLAILGNKLFIADSAAGLLELDVTNPAHPKLAGELRLPGMASWVFVDKGYVYVADGEGGIFIIQAVQESSTITNKIVAQQNGPANVPYNSLPVGAFAQVAPISAASFDKLPDQTALDQYLPASFLKPSSPINILARTESSADRACVVTSTADSGSGTLRECVQTAQSGDTITFDPHVFPPQKPTTIYITSELGLGGSGGITIDGSHAGVILDGSHAPKGTYCFNILSNNNVIKGLQILYFPTGGIALSGDHNIIGGDRSRGEAPLGEGNLISGNGDGEIGTKLASGNLIIGNYIGTDISGRHTLVKPGSWSIGIAGTSSSNRIERNVIAGPIGIVDSGSSFNEIVGNYIGTDATGTVSLGNNTYIVVNLPFNRIGGTRPGEGNVINGRIMMSGTSDVIVIGNLIGIDSTGKKAFPNPNWMINLMAGAHHNFIGGMTGSERNVIDGTKDSTLVHLDGVSDFNFIAGNYLGTDASGDVVFPNFAGIALEVAEHNTVQGNLIAGSQAVGVSLAGLDGDNSGANFNWIRANQFTKNGKMAIKVGGGEGNIIVDNTFTLNGRNAYDGGRNNRWDDGIKGNYWSDYKGKDKDGDGIGDSPYRVPPNGTDNYPLMKPFLPLGN